MQKDQVMFPLRSEGGPVGGFAVQEPENDPQPSLYLWTFQKKLFRMYLLRSAEVSSQKPS